MAVKMQGVKTTRDGRPTVNPGGSYPDGNGEGRDDDVRDGIGGGRRRKGLTRLSPL